MRVKEGTHSKKDYYIRFYILLNNFARQHLLKLL